MQNNFFCGAFFEVIREDAGCSGTTQIGRFIDELDVNETNLERTSKMKNSISTLPLNAIKFLRRRDVLQVMAISETELYRRLHAGLFVPPIAYGVRMKVWPAAEIWTLAEAHLQGKSDDEIRILVAQMAEARHA